jgi:hypothetical protein
MQAELRPIYAWIFSLRRFEVEYSSTFAGQNSEAFCDLSIPASFCSKSVPSLYVGEREIASGFPKYIAICRIVSVQEWGCLAKKFPTTTFDLLERLCGQIANAEPLSEKRAFFPIFSPFRVGNGRKSRLYPTYHLTKCSSSSSVNCRSATSHSPSVPVVSSAETQARSCTDSSQLENNGSAFRPSTQRTQPPEPCSACHEGRRGTSLCRRAQGVWHRWQTEGEPVLALSKPGFNARSAVRRSRLRIGGRGGGSTTLPPW